MNKQLYFSDNGRDWMSEDVPQDELNRVTKVGQDFGAPYCYQGNLPDPEFGCGPQVQRLRSAGRLDRAALGRARLALLHRRHVPEEVQERHLPCPPRLVEPDE